jgi:hypothetical protein
MATALKLIDISHDSEGLHDSLAPGLVITSGLPR